MEHRIKTQQTILHHMNDTTEPDFVRALSKGNIKAFEMLFMRYQPKLLHFLHGFIKDMELARDMAQDIFLSIWNDKHKLSEVRSFQAYLFRIAKCAICNYYDHLIVSERFLAEQLHRPARAEHMEEMIFAQQLQRMIDETVDRMPPQRKTIYTMSRVEGISNADIAKKLHINKRTVENHLTSALADLRKVVHTFIMLI